MIKSDQINELATALAKTQSELKDAVKDAQNPFFKSSYATLQSNLEACRPVLSKHGLSITQLPCDYGQGPALETVLMHSSGQFLGGVMKIITAKNDMQSLGSGFSYARRYSIAAIVGIAQEDDDAEATTERHAPKRAEPKQELGVMLTQATPKRTKIMFGSKAHLGKFIDEINPNELEQICKDIVAKAKENKKEITGIVKQFLDECESYLNAIEPKEDLSRAGEQVPPSTSVRVILDETPTFAKKTKV